MPIVRLETLLTDGKVRSIGVSNFMVEHLRALLNQAAVVPAVNQIECHPYFSQRAVRTWAPRDRHRHPGVVADRRHHLLRRLQPHQHSRRSSHWGDCHCPCQKSRSGHAAVGFATWALSHSQVHQAQPASPRTSTYSTSSCPSTRWPRSMVSTRAGVEDLSPGQRSPSRHLDAKYRKPEAVWQSAVRTSTQVGPSKKSLDRAGVPAPYVGWDTPLAIRRDQV